MKKLTAIGISAVAYFTLASNAFAQTIAVSPCPKGAATTGTAYNSLCNLVLGGNVFQNAVTIAFVVATLIALAFLIFGGIRWILSGGEKEKIEEARNTIVAALVGLVITFLAYFLINIVFRLFGLGNISSLQAIPVLNLFK